MPKMLKVISAIKNKMLQMNTDYQLVAALPKIENHKSYGQSRNVNTHNPGKCIFLVHINAHHRARIAMKHAFSLVLQFLSSHLYHFYRIFYFVGLYVLSTFNMLFGRYETRIHHCDQYISKIYTLSAGHTPNITRPPKKFSGRPYGRPIATLSVSP